MAYGLPPPPPHYHPSWDMEMSLVYPSCPLIPRCTATPPLPLSHLTLILTKHHLGKKKSNPLPAQHTILNPTAMETEPIFQQERRLMPDYLRSRPQYQPISLSRTNSDPTYTYVLMTRSQGLNSKFSTMVRHGGDLGPRPRRFPPSGLFFIFTGDVSLRTGPAPLL